MGRPTSEVEIEAWAEWALAEADRIDPVFSDELLTFEHAEAENGGDELG